MNTYGMGCCTAMVNRKMKFSEASGSSQPGLKLWWGKATGTYSMRSH